jgi:hypothetical protein
MPTPPPSITLDPAPHPALNYAGLRAEALELLGRLCGDQWSDFNSHDPGITILEQLCYALTELAWRSQWSIEDLLASTGSDWHPAAAEILAGDPVSRDDLLALLQSAGCPEVLVDMLEQPELPLYFRPSAAGRALAAEAAGSGRPPVAGDLELDADLLGRPTAGPPQSVTPQGVWRVVAQLRPEASGSGPASLLPIARRLHGARLLGRDFRLEHLDPFLVVVRVDLELHTAGVAPGLLDRLRRCLDAVISAAGASGQAGGLRGAALIQALQALPEVRRVISLGLSSSRSGPFHSWHLALPGLGARLDPASDIRLFHQGLPLQPPPEAAASTANPAIAAGDSPLALAGAGAAPPHRPARQRSLTSPGSLARQLPAVYGVGPDGLPAAASPERRVQALRLRAYLHVFDQLLANGHAQLAHATRLLAPVPPDDPRPLEAEAVRLAEDRALPLTDLTDLLQGRPDAWPEALRQALRASAPPDAANQRNALLAHLLRCFGEELELSARPPGSDAETPAELVAARSAFLRRIVPLTAGRGSGADLLADPPPSPLASTPPASAETSQGVFAERLRRKLGLPLGPDGTPPLLVIEHLLLRPLADDSSQRVQGGEDPIPFLSDVARPDPWSARVSVVVDVSRLPAMDAPVRDRWLVRLIRQELPAHLRAELHLLADDPATPGQGPWSRLLAEWGRFRTLLHDHRLRQLGANTISNLNASGPIDSQLLSLRLRDSRDQLISQLGIGLPWPLRAIPLPQQLMVATKQFGSIQLPYSQKGVRYQLVNAASGQPLGNPAEGSDGPLTLTTPPILEDITVRVLASVLTPAGGVALTANGRARSTLLAGEIRVLEGIDLGLSLRLLDASTLERLPLLDPAGASDNDGLARLANHNQPLVVEIVASQKGVRYQVIDRESKAPLCKERSGTSDNLRLALDDGAAEDLDLAVRAHLDKREFKEEMTLTAVLPLRVKANPAVPLRLLEAAVDPGASARVVIGLASPKKAKAKEPAPLVGQRGVCYELRVRLLGDQDWELADPLRPADKPAPAGSLTQVGGDLTDFSPPVGPAASGECKDDELTLETPIRGEGMVVAALARKQHRLHPYSHPNPATRPSEVPLRQAAVAYTRPDVNQPLILRREPDRPGVWTLWGGQPGLAYTLQPETDRVKASPMGPLLAIPEGNGAPGGVRGIGTVRVERDLVVNGAAGTAPAELTLDLAQAGEIRIWAHYLRSGVEVKLARPPILVWADPPGVCEGESARVVISRLAADQAGRLLLDGSLLEEGTADKAGHLTLASPLPGACLLQVDVGVRCPLWIDRSMSLDVPVRVVNHTPLLAGAPAHLVPWDDGVEVEVASSETNLTYTLINAADRNKPFEQQTTFCNPVPGKGGPLRLRCDGLRDDVDLLVRVTRVYDAAGTQQSTGVLTTILPLRVQANPNVPLRLLHPVVDPGASATVTIGANPAGAPTSATSVTQAEVGYQLQARPLGDEDWRFDDPASADAITTTTITDPLEGFTPREDSLPGNGKELTLELPISGEGMVLAVLAQKQHMPHPLSFPDTGTHPSVTPLRQAAVAYTKPDASRQLILRADSDRPGLWILEGGQPGVGYTLVDHTTPDAPVPWPPEPTTTLSQPSELPIPELQEAPSGLRGINRQRVGRDLIVGLSDSPGRAVTTLAKDPASIANLRVVARYLRSGVRVELHSPPTIVSAEPPLVQPSLVGGRRGRILRSDPLPQSFRQILIARQSDQNLAAYLLGSDGSVWIMPQTAEPGGWSAPASLGGSGYQQLVAGWSRDGRQQLFAVGADQAAWHNHQIDAQAGGWAGWTSLGGSIKQLAVASNADGRLELFGIGVKNGPLWELPQTLPDDAWGTWTSLAGGITEIRAGRNSDGRLEVFAIGTNKACYHIWQQEPGARWSGWVPLHGILLGMDLQTNADGRFQVFAIGSDHALWHIWQTQAGDSKSWGSWTKLGGSHQAIASAKHHDGRLAVFAVGADNRLSSISQTAPGKGWGAWANLGGAVVQVSAEPSADGAMQVLAIGTDGGVWQISQSKPNGGWSDWTKLPLDATP